MTAETKISLFMQVFVGGISFQISKTRAVQEKFQNCSNPVIETFSGMVQVGILSTRANVRREKCSFTTQGHVLMDLCTSCLFF